MYIAISQDEFIEEFKAMDANSLIQTLIGIYKHNKRAASHFFYKKILKEVDLHIVFTNTVKLMLMLECLRLFSKSRMLLI